MSPSTVRSKALRPEWLPAVALSAVLAALMLVWDPRVGDLAAQVFHTELFQQAGLAAEAKQILAAPPYLKECFHGEHWGIYEVQNPKPLIEPLGSGRANAVRVGPQGFDLDVKSPGEFLVGVSFTPYWSIGHGAGCLLRRGNWTVARTAHTGIFSADADFSLAGAWNAMTGAKKTC